MVDPSVETLTVMSSAQVGKTEILNNIVGYYIDQDPAPILLIQPTLEMGMAWSKDRFAPMLRDMPDLEAKFPEARAKDGGNTILHKVFRGGHITVAGANSPASLASRPIRIVAFDEVDKYPPSAGSEGDPVKLGAKRAQTFWNRKIVLVSTPTVRGISRIEKSYLDSDQRRYQVPCPRCGEFQELKWSNVKFDKADTASTHYECEACHAPLSERDKGPMLRRGRWVASAPEVRGHAGFYINELYSPWSTWRKVVEEFLEAKERPETLRVWINTSLGQTWEEEESYQISEGSLMARLEYYEKPPAEVLLLTAGVDVQEDRLECKVKGWGMKDESWIIGRRIFYGGANRPAVWRELLDYLLSDFEREDGRVLKVDAACIDSGYRTQEVYKFVKQNHHRRFFAVKGMGGAGRPFIGKISHNNKFRARTVMLGVDEGKRTIYSRLEIEEEGPGYLHFNEGNCDEDYFSQLTAEKQITKHVAGYPRKVWVLVAGRRNEMLDCEVYAYAAKELINPNMEKLAEARGTLDKKSKEEPQAEKPRARRPVNSFLNSWRR